jgi:5-methylcytosine-specific restriction enzyme subunit McrC
MPEVIVHEGEQIALPATLDRRHVTDQLLRYSARSAFPCFRLKRGVLFAAEVVGTIQVGTLRISILPLSAEGDQEHDRAFLMNLLRAAGYLGTRPAVHAASVRSTTLDPLEAMLIEVGSEMREALRDGAPRRYNEVAEEAQTIRGRIDFTRLCRQLPGTSVALPIRYAPLSATNLLARTIRWVAESLLSMARRPEARQILEEVLSNVSSTPGARPTVAEVAGIRLSRFEQRWLRTVAVAALLADGRFIDPTAGGRSDAFGMLFPLHHLFERAMRGVLSRTAKPLGLTVEHASNALNLLQDADGVGHLQVRPDFLFCMNGVRVLIGDAKWKRMSTTQRAGGVGRDDVFQMNAYLTRYAVGRGAIFVPRAGWMPVGWRHDFTIQPSESRLSVLSVDIQALLSRVSATSAAALESLQASIREVAGLASAAIPTHAADLAGPPGT